MAQTKDWGMMNCYQQLKEAENIARLAAAHETHGIPGSKRWTVEQEQELEQVVASYVPMPGKKKWDVICSALGNYRTAISLELHYQGMVRQGKVKEAGGGGGVEGGDGEGAAEGGERDGKRKRKGPSWTEEEDKLLEEALKAYVPSKNTRKWQVIAQAMGNTRPVDAVKCRAEELSLYALGQGREEGGVEGGEPAEKKGKKRKLGGSPGEEQQGKGHWTPEEDARNAELFHSYPESVPLKQRWAEIATKMGRSTIAVEQRYQKVQRAAKAAASSAEGAEAAAEEEGTGGEANGGGDE
jgi:hypothetical protein